MLDKSVLQTKANPAAHQDHIIDMPTNNLVPSGYISTEPKNNTDSDNLGFVSSGNDDHGSSIEMPHINRSRISTMNRAMTNCVAKDKR